MKKFDVSILTSQTDCNKYFTANGGTTPGHSGRFDLEVFSFDTTFDLADKLLTLTSKQVIMLDVPIIMPPKGHVLHIVPKKEFIGMFGTECGMDMPCKWFDGLWYMPRINTGFRRGGVMLLDVDGCEGKEHIGVDDIIKLLGIEYAPMVYTPSNTSRVLDIDNKKCHVFVLTDGGDCKNWMSKAAKLLQSKGMCNANDGKKTLIDTSVGAINRVIYEGAPTVDPMNFSLSVAPKVVRIMGGTELLDLESMIEVTDDAAMFGMQLTTGRDLDQLQVPGGGGGVIDRTVLMDDTIVKLKNGEGYYWKDVKSWNGEWLQRVGENDSNEWKVRCFIPECVRSGSTACSGFIKMKGGEVRLLDASGGMIWYASAVAEVDWSDVAGGGAGVGMGSENKTIKLLHDQFGVVLENMENTLRAMAPQLELRDVISIEDWRKAYGRAFIIRDRLYIVNSESRITNYASHEYDQIFTATSLRVDLSKLSVGGLDEKESIAEKKKIRKRILNCFTNSLKAFYLRTACVDKIDLFAKESHIDKTTDVVQHMRPFTGFAGHVGPLQFTDMRHVLRFKEHFIGLDDFIDSIVDARFSPVKRKCNHIFECKSGWGKTFFFEYILARLGIVQMVTPEELKKAHNGDPSGLTPGKFDNCWIIVVDEATFIPAIFKRLDKVLNIAAKGQQRVDVDTHTKVLLCAEGFMNNGVDDQLRNRFNIYIGNESFDFDCDSEAILRYVADRMLKRIDGYIVMGERDAGQVAEKCVNEYFEAHSIREHTVSQYSDIIVPAIDELVGLLSSCVVQGGLPKLAGHGTGDKRLDEELQVHLKLNLHNEVVVMSPMKVVSMFMNHKFDIDELKSIKRSRSKYMTYFGAVKSHVLMDKSNRKGVLLKRATLDGVNVVSIDD